MDAGLGGLAGPHAVVLLAIVLVMALSYVLLIAGAQGRLARRRSSTKLAAPLRAPDAHLPSARELAAHMLPLVPQDALLWAPPADADAARHTHLFAVTHANGFLPFRAPLRALPAAFAPLETLLVRLPELLHDRGDADALARQVRALPLVDVRAALDAAREPHDGALAHALCRDYSILVSAVLIETKAKGGSPRTAVPRELSVPLFELCALLKMPAIMEYSSYCLGNVAVRGDSLQSSHTPDYEATFRWHELGLIRSFDGGREEASFIVIHAEMEAKCGRLVLGYARLLRALRNTWADDAGQALPAPRTDLGSVAAVIAGLALIKDATDAILVAQLKMFNASDPRHYVRHVREWIFGWKGNPEFPDGVLYEGVGLGGIGERKSLRGETGAQSTIVPSLDAVLGITHSADDLRVLLADLDAYRPEPHREFLAQLRSLFWGPHHGHDHIGASGGASVCPVVGGGEGAASAADDPSIGPTVSQAPHLLRDFVRATGCRALVRAYNACVGNVYAFRAIHVCFAEAYIARFTTLENATGGTPYRAYLRKHRGESEASQILDGPGGVADAACFIMPTPEESKRDLDAIFSVTERQGVPHWLVARHLDIITRLGMDSSGSIEPSLREKAFLSQDWAEGARKP